ncbi:group I intron-associated PD-(D/E)XK endonuclease [Fischerella major]|uniref:group I intron-associated PD-(D/E)XK endonuclease n=1 Tax=Fischerella major TaxID=210993 RepID=UPI000AA79C67|nr:group I intron-associated PD-(D/E)XK endonuclease [Fischerella major]
MHHTKDKGDIAAAKAIADLVDKGYSVFTPVVCEHLPFDLIAYKDGQCYRIQAKYNSNGAVKNKTSWTDKNGCHEKKYKTGDFDFYALYLPDINKVIYPSIKFGGCKIRTTPPKSPSPFYWWEDFIDFTEDAPKRTYKEFGVDLTTRKVNLDSRIHTRKVERPSKAELQKLVWEKPTTQIAKDFGVSDKAVEKWCKVYRVEKPPRGYWVKKIYEKI